MDERRPEPAAGPVERRADGPLAEPELVADLGMRQPLDAAQPEHLGLLGGEPGQERSNFNPLLDGLGMVEGGDSPTDGLSDFVQRGLELPGADAAAEPVDRPAGRQAGEEGGPVDDGSPLGGAISRQEGFLVAIERRPP